MRMWEACGGRRERSVQSTHSVLFAGNCSSCTLNDALLVHDSVDSAFAFVRKTINQVPPVTACPRDTYMPRVRRRMPRLQALVKPQPLHHKICDSAVLSPAWQRLRSEGARAGRQPPSRPNLRKSHRLPARCPWSNLSTVTHDSGTVKVVTEASASA